jgi:hypothetical protein
MLVKLANGVDPATVEAMLREVAADALNARNAGGLPRERVDTYLRWANNTALRLRNQVADTETDRLVLTASYYALVVLTREPSPQIGEMVDRELAGRAADLDAAAKALARLRSRWPEGALIVLDTSVFIAHPDKIEDMDLREWARVRHEPIHLVVPMIVVDELDNSKQRHGHVGWRAAYSLAAIDARAPHPGQAGTLRDKDFSSLTTGSGEIPFGQVVVEVWPDPPGHVRLAISDDEIVERAVTVQQLAGRPVAFVTYDTGQAMRARGAGLTVWKLKHPREDEAEPSR